MAASRKLLLQISLQTAQAVKEMERMKGQMAQLASHTSNMGKSMFNAQAMFHLFRKAVSEVWNFFKGSIEEFKRHNAAVAQTNAVLKSTGYAAGMTSKELVALSNSMMNVTTYEHDAILEAENLLLTFTKIGKDIFPAATEAVLDTATALHKGTDQTAIMVGKLLNSADAMGAAKKVGISFTAEQMKLGKELQASGRMAEYQAMILKELQIEFGGSAKAARQTFGGALEALKNAFGEVKEGVGGMLAAIGQPLVEFFTDMFNGISKFIESKEGIEIISNVLGTLAGIFSVLFEIGKQIVDAVFGALKSAIKPVIDLLNELFPAGKENNAVFDVFAQIMKVIAFVLGIVGKVIGIVIKTIINLGKSFYETGKLAVKFIEWIGDISNPTKWKAFNEQASKAGEAWKTLGKDLAAGIWDVITESGKELKNWNTDVKNNSDKMVKIYEKAFDKIKTKYKAMKEGAEGEGAFPPPPNEENLEEYEKATAQIKENADAIGGALGNAADDAQKKWLETFKSIQDGMTEWLGIASDIVGQISNIFSQYYENQLTALDNDYQARREAIEQNVTDEAARDEALAALDAEYAAKRRQLKQQEWQAEHNAAIIQAIINTALAVTSALATQPFIVGLILAGVAATLGGIQTALIASQPMPTFAQGGSFTTNGPQAFMAGDNSGGVEEVTVTPVSSYGSNSQETFVTQPFIIQIDGNPIYRGLLSASKAGIALISGRAVVS